MTELSILVWTGNEMGRRYKTKLETDRGDPVKEEAGHTLSGYFLS